MSHNQQVYVSKKGGFQGQMLHHAELRPWLSRNQPEESLRSSIKAAPESCGCRQSSWWGHTVGVRIPARP